MPFTGSEIITDSEARVRKLIVGLGADEPKEKPNLVKSAFFVRSNTNSSSAGNIL